MTKRRFRCFIPLERSIGHGPATRPARSDSSAHARAAVGRLLRPLVRVLLRNGMPFGAFADLAKQVYVDVAIKEFNDLPWCQISCGFSLHYVVDSNSSTMMFSLV